MSEKGERKSSLAAGSRAELNSSSAVATVSKNTVDGSEQAGSSTSVGAETQHAGERKEDVAQLILPDGRVITLPVLKPTMGNEMTLDIQQLFSHQKVIMFDPGFNSTSACASSITYIDGDEGVCLYRGYPVHELTAHNDYLDVCYLLLHGQLPTTIAKKLFEREVKNEMLLHNRLQEFITSFVPGAHPMSILASVVSAFASFYSDPMSADHIDSYEVRELACVRLIAKLPTVVAGAYKTLIGEPLVYPRADLSYAENFLHMMFSKPIEPYHVSPLHSKIIDTFLIIHADHEQNASTSTVRSAGSSLANPYTCIASGITSLWGRAHGGANEAVIKMLNEIGTPDNIPSFIEKVKNKELRLMGFGHRIYRNYDPRAKLMQELCYKLRDVADDSRSNTFFDLALSLERAALADTYFTSRKLYPNVDFYSGVVMRYAVVHDASYFAVLGFVFQHLYSQNSRYLTVCDSRFFMASVCHSLQCSEYSGRNVYGHVCFGPLCRMVVALEGNGAARATRTLCRIINSRRSSMFYVVENCKTAPVVRGRKNAPHSRRETVYRTDGKTRGMCNFLDF